MAKKHNERCKTCKARVKELLHHIFGKVIVNYNLDLPSAAEDYSHLTSGKELTKIHQALQEYRDNKHFVKAKKMPHVDFFIPEPGFIVEFDESQHFTKLREIALANYPSMLTVGFDKMKWMELCSKLNKKDNDPIYRDEQRAWYDTLRDFAPAIKHLKPTVRLFASDFVWCSLDPTSKDDIQIFAKIIGADTF